MTAEQHHPISDVALAALSTGAEAGQISLESTGAARLEAALRARLTAPDLISAVTTLLDFAMFLRDRCRAPDASDAVTALVVRVAAPAVIARASIGGGANAQAREAADQLAAFEARRRGAVLESRRDPQDGQVRSSPLARFAMDGALDGGKK